MEETKLTTASYLVLGLVEMSGPVTPYDLKRIASETVANFWALPHTQIYTQCDRLAEAELLEERQEDDGRRRRQFTITERGRAALDEWRKEPPNKRVEIRDLSLLKLFFGADAGKLAEQQIAIHSEALERFREYEETAKQAPAGVHEALRSGIGHQEEFVRFWESLSDEAADK
jgi:DNA-binding PadR family transcriptional regulator